ncbi:MAG: hypothetical protein IKB71_07795 [Lentisphaeria bacterium]|nr:hypothetical protein [Lentisphaeria bacterium]
MENKDFETILVVKEFENCCLFYQGLLADLQISIAGNFLMKFVRPCGKTLKVFAADPLDNNFVPMPAVLEFQMEQKNVQHALNFLLQHDYKFISENNTIRTADPSGNIILLHGSDKCDMKSISASQKTQKIDIA